MKIKELLESLSEVMNIISEIRINGFHFKSFDEIYNIKNLASHLEVDFWRLSDEKNDIVLIIHSAECNESQEPDGDREEEVEEEELTVGDVLSSICFDDENTIVIYNRYNGKMYDSDEDDVFALCELLCLDVKEYTQIHRGKHQTIEIHLKSY